MGTRYNYDAFKGTRKKIIHSHSGPRDVTKSIFPSLPKAEGRLILPSGGLGGVLSSAGKVGGAAASGGIVGASLNKAGSTIAAFPQGAGFGLGYGVGVRIGYEGLFPNIKAGNYPGLDKNILGLIPGFNLGSTGFWEAGERERRAGKSARFPGVAAKAGIGGSLVSQAPVDTGTKLRNLPSFIGPTIPERDNTPFSGSEIHWFQTKLNTSRTKGLHKTASRGLSVTANNWIRTNSSNLRYLQWVRSNR